MFKSMPAQRRNLHKTAAPSVVFYFLSLHLLFTWKRPILPINLFKFSTFKIFIIYKLYCTTQLWICSLQLCYKKKIFFVAKFASFIVKKICYVIRFIFETCLFSPLCFQICGLPWFECAQTFTHFWLWILVILHTCISLSLFLCFCGTDSKYHIKSIKKLLP